MRRTIRTAAAAASALAVLTACTASGPSGPSQASSAPTQTSREPVPNQMSSATAPSTPAPTTPTRRAAPPFRRVLVVVMENRSYRDILTDPDAPFLRRLAATGTNYTDFHAETHPSQPNYLALFSGGTQGITDDSCPHAFGGENLGRQLLDAGDSFAAYSEDLPRAGWPGCSSGAYARKHAPWTNFTDLPGSVSLPMSRFPADLNRLPDVAFVIPNLDHDMHDGTIAEGDTWLAAHVGGYATWARTHDSLLVVTFDEDDRSEGNLIPTIAVGQGVPSRTDGTPLNHYSLLAGIEDAFGLARLGQARAARPMRLTG